MALLVNSSMSKLGGGLVHVTAQQSLFQSLQMFYRSSVMYVHQHHVHVLLSLLVPSRAAAAHRMQAHP